MIKSVTRIGAVFNIIRPINVFISLLSVYLGGIISTDKFYSDSLLLACISAAFIAGFGNVCNDIFDIDIDRRSKPFRPLASALISVRSAITLALTMALCGLVLAALINIQCFLIASLASIALLLYTPCFKGSGYAGNILISIVSASAFFYGAASVGNIRGGLIPAVFAFLFHLVREIVKDMEDFEADRECNVKTGVVKYGFGISRFLAIAFTTILAFATIVPYLIRLYGLIYLAAVILGTDLFLLYFVICLIRLPEKRTYRFVAGFMKAVMPLGILAVFIGSRGF